MTNTNSARRLLIGSAFPALILAAFAAPAVAQDAAAPQPTPPAPSPVAGPNSTTAVAATADAEPAGSSNQDIVVTGTVFRRTNRETPSPLTVLTADDLAKRGITTVSDAIQSLSANNGSNLPAAFSANGAFANGATGVSLRGLSTNSTLVLFDGLRAASYPLADDGVRSFVDLNTIPDAIVDRVEVLKDGASSTYGADAVAGVVNVILKKQITGVQGTVEGGLSQRGDAGHQRIDLTAGYGDLDRQGFNIYVSGEYQHDDMLMNGDRGFPYNTQDLSRKVADDGVTPDQNTNPGATGVDIHYNTDAAVVQPATLSVPGNIWSGVAVPGGLTSVLNPSGCGAGLIFHSDASGTRCEQNVVGRYGVLQPEDTRIGGTIHAVARLTDNIEAYVTGTFYQNKVFYTGEPNGTRFSQPTTARFLTLPALLRDGSVNPYDPYANIVDPATGQRESALLNYEFSDVPASTTDTSNTYRIAGGINGSFGDGWNFTVDGTYMKTNLKQVNKGLLDYTAVQDAIETGSYNFIDPSQNSPALRAALSPTLVNRDNSSLWQIQGTITKDLFDLPGGALKVGVGGQIRHESIYDPVGDPSDNSSGYSAYQLFPVNLFNAIGHRYVEAGYFEVDAPVLKQLDINVSGRYDHYSEGFSHFSPKIGAKFTPIPQIALRGTFSKGFRAPSIPEGNGQVIGFVNATPPADVAAAHGNDTYVQPYSLGEFNSGNPNLKPELSTNFTAGAVVQPVRWLSVTADFYHIKKTHTIVEGPQTGDAIAAYYASGGTNLNPLPGYTITQNPVDPNHPDAVQTIDIVSASFINSGSLVTSGLDFSATAQVPLSDHIRLTSTIEATKIIKLNLHVCSTGAGCVEHFAGTEGPYANTSDSGTPKWRGNWSNTLEIDNMSLTGTAYYTGGYMGTADDYSGAGTSGDCANAISPASDGATPEQCHVKHFIDVDFVGAYKVNEKFTIYANVINLFDAKAPFDPNTYGGVNYNPAFAEAGVVGRFFRVGANFKF